MDRMDKEKENSEFLMEVGKAYLNKQDSQNAEKYLKTSPEPIIPLNAYAMGLMSITEMFLGNKPEADKWKEEATKSDKYFSRA